MIEIWTLSEQEGQWTLPICLGCGGIWGYKLEGGCTCDPTHAKIGKSIEVVPVSWLDEVEQERDEENETLIEVTIDKLEAEKEASQLRRELDAARKR